MGKLFIFAKKYFIASGLDEHGWQTGQIAVDGGKTRVINRQASGIGGVQYFWIQWSGTA